jgi:solute carrier family 25 carnitine/acylcarnitine transporter 20/29
MDELIGGACGGIAQTVAGYPFDTIKVHQVAREIKSPWQATTHLFRKQGLYGFYRGIYSPMVGAVVINAHTFYMYDKVKQHFHYTGKEWSRAIAGASVGLTLTVWETPVEVIKIHMQLNSQTTYQQAVREVNLFRGFGATAARNVYALWAVFWGYEETKALLPKNPLIGSFLGGAVGGFICWAPIYPVDFIKTRIQSYEPWRGLPWKTYWRGFTPCVVRATAVNPFIFLAYEIAMQNFHSNLD